MLVGRANERRAIDALVAGARVGQSGVLVLAGQPGIGKTALLEYAESIARDALVLRATGSESEREVPFGGLAQLLRPLVPGLGRIPPPQAHALGIALALQEGTAADRFTVGAATLSLLTMFSEDRPLGLILDDGHWLDRPSAEAIVFAARRLLADSIFVIGAVRSDEPTPLTADLPVLSLDGLDLAGTEELLRDTIDGADTRDLPGRLHRVTGGNPLAILALARDPARLRSLPPDSPAPVPSDVGRLFAGQADELDHDAHLAVLLAAASGGDLATVSRACVALGVDVAALARAEEAGLVHVDAGRIEFAHPLIRSSVYTAASPSEQRSLHACLAEAVPDLDADRRAWHRSQATFGPDDDVAAAMAEAAARAFRRGAYSVSATAYDRAGRLSSVDSVRAEHLLSGAEAAWEGGDGHRAGEMVEEGLALDRGPLYAGRALGLQGVIAARTGSLQEASDILARAAGIVGPLDPERAIVLLAEMINACFYLGDAAGALATADRLEDVLHGGVQGPSVALAQMAAGIGRILAGHPGADDIRDATRMLVDTAEPAGRAFSSSWLVLGPMFLRDSTSGRPLVRQAVADLRASSSLGALPHLLFHVARDEATTDHLASARADYNEAVDLARELGQTTELAISLAGLAWLEARLGLEGACRDDAAEALDICSEQRIHLGRAWSLFALGELELSQGDAVAATGYFEALTTLLDETGVRDVDLSPAPEQVEALLRLGDTASAHDLATSYSARAEAKGQPWARARAARARGLLAEEAELDKPFEEALSLHAQTLDTFEQARTLLCYGARLRRARRRVDARRQLRAALETFERLGARPWADAAADELSATGETARRTGSSGLSQLTPRELQISRLLIEGKTTRQAAAALFLSPKTVEYHLRNVYIKLGINSRSELSEHVRGSSV